MSKLKEVAADTPDVPILQKVFGKTIEWIEIIVVVVVAIGIAKVIGFL